MKNDYYKAYDKRYRQTYENNSLWEISERTKEREKGFDSKRTVSR